MTPPVKRDDLPTIPAAVQKTKIDLEKALELRLKGLSFRDIGKYFGCAHTSVAERLRPYVQNDDIDLDTFKKNRADLLTMKQGQVMAAMSQEDIDKASLRDKAIVFGTLYDKERLERGQSTSNQSVFFQIVQTSDQAEAIDITPDE